MRTHAGELFSGPKPHWLSELRGLGARVQVLKVVIPNVGVKLFTPWGRSQGVLCPVLIVGCSTEGGVYGEMYLSLSYPF